LAQKPPRHAVLQHSLFAPHASPNTLQEPPPSCAHMLLVQVWVQHSELPEQAVPVALHAVLLQVPALQAPKQQSVFAVHDWPAFLQNWPPSGSAPVPPPVPPLPPPVPPLPPLVPPPAPPSLLVSGAQLHPAIASAKPTTVENRFSFRMALVLLGRCSV
jgi:hypothetical protein